MSLLLKKSSLPPKMPGVKGGKGYWDRMGQWHYGDPPLPKEREDPHAGEGEPPPRPEEEGNKRELEKKNSLRFILDSINKGDQPLSAIPVSLWPYVQVDKQTGQFSVRD